MKLSRLLPSALFALAVLAASCGGSDDASTGTAAARTVDVEMIDIRFEPATLAVARGETVNFVFTNTGKVNHDAFVGDMAAQAAHEADMMGTGEGGHDGHGGGGAADSQAVTVSPGESATLRHTFDQAGQIEIGCHEPGHYAAGMKIAVTVT